MLCERLGLSERRACRIAGQHRSTQRHEPKRAPDDAVLRRRLRAIAAKKPRWGYRRAHAHLLSEGFTLNRKRVQRVWREEGLRVPARKRKRRRLGESSAEGANRLRATHPGHVWALDFQHDATTDGRELKFLNVVDEFTREALAIEVERTIDADQTVATLQAIVTDRGIAPENIRADNGPELTARVLREWCQAGSTDTAYIDPGLRLAEPLRGVLQRQGPRRTARRRGVRLSGRGPGAGRRLPRRVQRAPPPLGAWHDVAEPFRCQLAAKRLNPPNS